jgi:hypothetical protein
MKTDKKSFSDKRWALRALSGAVAALLSGPAVAGQGYVHADICSWTGGSGAYYLSELTNESATTSMTAECAVTQSDAFNTAPKYFEFQFNGYDHDGVTGVTYICTGIIEDTTHHVVAFVGDLEGPIGTYQGPINLKSSSFIPGLTSYAYTARCSLPIHSSLYNVRVGNPT